MTNFLSISSADAQNIFRTVKSAFEENNLLTSILVGHTSDGASVVAIDTLNFLNDRTISKKCYLEILKLGF